MFFSSETKDILTQTKKKKSGLKRKADSSLKQYK